VGGIVNIYEAHDSYVVQHDDNKYFEAFVSKTLFGWRVEFDANLPLGMFHSVKVKADTPEAAVEAAVAISEDSGVTPHWLTHEGVYGLSRGLS
jgi:tellurite resistance protein